MCTDRYNYVIEILSSGVSMPVVLRPVANGQPLHSSSAFSDYHHDGAETDKQLLNHRWYGGTNIAAYVFPLLILVLCDETVCDSLYFE